MNAILTPYYEPNVEMMALYEELYYDDIDPEHTFPKPKKYVRQYNLSYSDIVYDDIDPVNLTNAFNEVSNDEYHINDLITNISACFPTNDLKTITNNLNIVYSDTKTMESFMPGQRIGDYEYIASETNDCVILYGRKHSSNDYFILHYWPKDQPNNVFE